MLVRLTRAKRLRAGWFIALIYMLCVVAPTISYALPGAHAPAPCLMDHEHVPGMVHVHSGPQHVHEHGRSDHHAAMQANAAGDHDSMSLAVDGRSDPGKGAHPSDGQCCGLISVSALPATLIEFVTPSVPRALCVIECYCKVSDDAPPTLYRPPIS